MVISATSTQILFGISVQYIGEYVLQFVLQGCVQPCDNAREVCIALWNKLSKLTFTLTQHKCVGLLFWHILSFRYSSTNVLLILHKDADYVYTPSQRLYSV